MQGSDYRQRRRKRKERKRVKGREKSSRRKRRNDIFFECLVIMSETRVYSRHRQVIGLVGHIGNFSHFISHAEFGVYLGNKPLVVREE